MSLRRAATDFEQLEMMVVMVVMVVMLVMARMVGIVGSVERPQVNYYPFPCLGKMMGATTILAGDGQHESIHVALAPEN